METSRVAATPFFADLPEDELGAIASVASEVEIASGQALAAEGRVGHSLFAIESGTADVVMMLDERRAQDARRAGLRRGGDPNTGSG